MDKNMGEIERFIRTAVAGGIVGLILGGKARVTLGIVAVVFFITGAARICPLYVLFGFRTSKGSRGGEGPARIDV